MSEERSQFAQRIDERKFSPSRKGYDKREVQDYLEDLEQAFRELEGHASRASQRVGELERDLSKTKATERVSVDNAMMAVFDAKDRILDRARRRADEIEEEAHGEAGRIRESALTEAGGADGSAAGEIAAARAQADEIVAAARREADRLRSDATSDVTQDLEAEMAALAAQVRRAHDDTAAVKTDLDAARQHIVELETAAADGSSEDLEQRFAELAEHLNATKADVARLQEDLDERDKQVAALNEAVAAAEQALDQSKSYVAKADAALEAKDAETDAVAHARDAETQAALEAKDAAVEQLRQDLAAAHTESEALRSSQDDAQLAASRVQEIEAALEAKDHEIVSLHAAADQSETTHGSLQGELTDVRQQLDTAQQEADASRAELEKLREHGEKAQATDEALAAVQTELADQRQQAEALKFVQRMSTVQASLADTFGRQETAAMIAEIGRSRNGQQLEDVQTKIQEGESSLAEAHEKIASLEAQLGEIGEGTADLDNAKQQAEAILAAAREEAEAIESEAEEEAEQRAAKVIASARDEADQVRQTVATLTGQAEDARSAALRSKLEAEDLAETQRSIGDAREDIVASAKTQAEELEQEAQRVVADAKAEAEQAIAAARSEAVQTKADTEEQAQAIIAAAENKAEELLAEAEVNAAARLQAEADVVDSGDDLAALLAEAEQEVAISEELRRQREEIIQREQDLADRERSFAAKHEDAAMSLTSARGGAAETMVSTETVEPAVDPEPVMDLESVDVSPAEDSADDSDDPADRLSALLEQVAPTASSTELTEDEPVDLDRLSQDLGDQPRTRMAWPTPVDRDDSAARPTADDAAQDDDDADDAADDDADPDPDDAPRESRYRTRSAQLPRLGDQAKSNMTTMANLRKKSRGVNN